MELIALVDMSRFNVRAGEQFTIPDKEGRILKAVKKAKDAHEKIDVEPSKGEYRTREMTAKKKK